MLSNFLREGRVWFAAAAVAVAFVSACDRSASQDMSDRLLHEENGESSASSDEGTAMDDEPFTPSRPVEFVGSWEAVSDDGTNTETAELELADGAVTGVIRSLERGYYSGRVTVNAEVILRGTPRAGA